MNKELKDKSIGVVILVQEKSGLIYTLFVSMLFKLMIIVLICVRQMRVYFKYIDKMSSNSYYEILMNQYFL